MPITGIGILGDSVSDEYRADDNRGGSYAATTLNWMELLAKKQGFNFGTWGTRNDSRRTGYEYNWALSGATAGDVISLGQHTGLAQQVREGKVTQVVLYVGANDFALWNGTYAAIYNGTLTDQQVQDKVNAIISNLTLAVDTIQAAGPVEMAISNLLDRGSSVPEFIATFPQAAGRQRVTNAILAVNEGIASLAASRGIALINLYTYSNTLLSRMDTSGNLVVDGELISLLANGNEPHHVIISDGEHVGTVGAGLMANYITNAFNTFYGQTFVPFTDHEIVTNAGIIQPPAIASFTADALAVTAGTPVTLAWATDNGTSVTLGGIGNVNASGSLIVTPSATTTYTLAVQNIAGTTVTRSITIAVHPLPDTQAPAVEITNPSSGSDVSGIISLSANASDNTAVAGVQFYVDDSAYGNEVATAPYTLTLNTATLTNGPHTVRAVARDASGNTAESSTISFTTTNTSSDTQPPTIEIVTPGTSALLSGTVAVSANASDNVAVSQVQFYVDGNPIGGPVAQAPYGISWNTASVSEGAHTLTAVATDSSGLSSSVTINVTTDNIAPTIVITSPANNETIWGTVTFNATVFDAVGVVGVQFKGDGQNAGSEQTSAPYALVVNTTYVNDGAYTVTVVARDAAGHVTTSAPVVVNVLNHPTYTPSAYNIAYGEYSSGSVSNLGSDDDAYLTFRSLASGPIMAIGTDFSFTGVRTTLPTLTFTVRAKASAASSATLYAYNVLTGNWDRISSYSMGTTESTRRVTIYYNVARYLDSNGTVKLRFANTRTTATPFYVYNELVQLQ